MSDTPQMSDLSLLGDLLEALEEGALLYGADGRLRWANRRARSLLGLGDAPVAGQTEAQLKALLEARGVRFASAPPGPEAVAAPQVAHRRHGLPAGGHIDLYREIESPEAVRRAVLEAALHDLRSPVASVRSYASLLAAGKLGGGDPRVQKAGESMLRAIDRGLAITRDFLDSELARLGLPALLREPRDLAELVRSAVASRAHAVREREVAVEVRLPEGPVEASVDPDRLAQALGALLDQALTRSPAGAAVTVSLELFAHELQVAFTDRGPPLDEQALLLAFDRDARIARDRRLQPAAALAAARATATAHGGALGLTARPGSTTFHLSLPR